MDGERTESMGKKGRKVKGGLFERGGVWWGRWTAFGVRNRKSTGVKVGRGQKGKAESRAAAQEVLDGWVVSYKAEDAADVRASLAVRARSAEEKAREAVADALARKGRIPLAKAWERNPYDTSQTTRGRTRVHALTEKNVAENRGAWEKFVRWARAEHGADAAMQDVTEEWARAYSKHVQDEGLTPQRHNKLLTTAGVMFRLAGVAPNPFAGVEKLREAEAEHREPFTKEQVRRLLDAAEGEWRGFLAVLYYMGLRRGDAATLRWNCRDAATGKWHVRMAKTGKVVEPCEHPELAAVLRETASKGKSGYLFPGIAAQYRTAPNGLSDWFRRFAGKVLGERDGEDGTFRAFEVCQERTGGGKRRVSRYGLHSFRHSFASHAAQAGVPLGVLQAWLGHSSEEITRIYTHYGKAAELEKIMRAVSLGAGGGG